jgi:lipopolysaccharide transport system ATP-binding protein
VSDIVIQADQLGKKYTIAHQAEHGRYGYVALRDVLTQQACSLWHKTRDLVQGKAIVQGDTLEEVWALKDVSFAIRRGETVGIVGHNGVGKSTLLKILSRITEPSAGRVTIKGQVGSLLEVGTGFHAELTGRENIYLNGAILGMTRQEIKRKFDEIVVFAEVEKYLDTPVKRYSSGMYVRLAFAVAAHLEPAILLVDEVLAVGDVAFQKKCLGKMSDVAHEGRTVLFVSHNMGAVQALCPQSILLHKGALVMFQDTATVIAAYLAMQQAQEVRVVLPPIASDAFFTAIALYDAEEQASNMIPVQSSFTIALNYQVNRPIVDLDIGLSVYNSQGTKIFFCPQSSGWQEEHEMYPAGTYRGEVTIPGGFLAPGYYTITVDIAQPNVQFFDLRRHIIGFQIIESGSLHYKYAGGDVGAVLVKFPWSVKKMGEVQEAWASHSRG